LERTRLARVKNLVKFQLFGRLFLDCCIAVGEGVYDDLIKANFPRQKLALVRNGISAGRFRADAPLRQSLRQALGVAERQTVFLLLGWDPARKGVDIFIKAAEAVKRCNSNGLFLIVGRAETRRFAANIRGFSKLGSAVRVIEPTENFAGLLNAVDVLVSPSRREAFSYAIAEAMSVGRLILCSDIPGMRAMYGKCQGAYFFPNEDWERLAHRMLEVIEEPAERRKSFGEANAGFVAKHYSLEGWADQVINIYDRLLEA
jgi:glycosyltransferase involved in cell wall biosynthesis